MIPEMNLQINEFVVFFSYNMRIKLAQKVERIPQLWITVIIIKLMPLMVYIIQYNLIYSRG